MIREKLTSDAPAIHGAKHRQRLAIGQDGDVTLRFFAERFVSGLVREKNDPRETYQ